MTAKAATKPANGVGPEVASAAEFPTIIGEFRAFESLFQGQNPLFNSEPSARWFFRNNRKELAEAEAIALHLGRYLVHLEKFRNYMLIAALKAAKNK